MNCKIEGCNKQASGKSKYCKEHAKIAREKWLAMIEAQKQEKQEKLDNFKRIWDKAVQAGREALNRCTPTPMVVQQHASPLDDNSPVVQQWSAPGGVCGFAWVNVSPGNCSFANWLKKNKLAGKAYYGGVDIWVREGGQSYERKMEFARAMAKVLNENRDTLAMPKAGRIYASGRLD